MKTVLFVPGFDETISTRRYGNVLAAIEAMGYTANFVPLHWKRTTIDDWVKEFDAVYASYDPAQTVLSGFSYGAMTAFVAAAHRLPFALWLFSLSSYFAEDIVALKREWLLRDIGKRRTESFSHLSFAELAPLVICPTYIFVGEKEAEKYPLLAARCAEAARVLKYGTLIRVPECGHDVTHPNYIAAIRRGVE